MRHAVATHAPLVNPDYEAARDYIKTGRPFELSVDASDYGYSAVLCQRAEVHGTPRPIAVLSKSFDETKQRWTPMEREMHSLYEGSVWSQKFVKSFKVFLYTDHKNEAFRSKVQPTQRVTKKLLKLAGDTKQRLRYQSEPVVDETSWSHAGDSTNNISASQSWTSVAGHTLVRSGNRDSYSSCQSFSFF